MSRLEKAVSELVTVATDEWGERATRAINQTSKHLEAELRMKKRTEEDPGLKRARERRRRRRRSRHRFDDRVEKKTGRLYIDGRDEKIAGVCSAFGRYFGIESWIVRMIAITGLIFMPQVVFPGYWIAYFVIEKRKPNPGEHEDEMFADEYDEHEDGFEEEAQVSEKSSRKSKKERRKERRRARSDKDAKAEENMLPRHRLRRVTSDMTDAELRLRRLEGYVTSDRYELQRELHRIEREGDGEANAGGSKPQSGER